MAMQIHGNYDHSGTDYAERVKEKQARREGGKGKGSRKGCRGKKRW